MTTNNREQYGALIDLLVRSCLEAGPPLGPRTTRRTGQGRIGPARVRWGVWDREAAVRPGLRDQQKTNDLLARTGTADRDVLDTMLFDAFVSGVHEALVVLHGQAVPPFEDGYEGTPFHDFAGTLHGRPWPTS